jgi:acyl-coenzyme A synthetase/AMP-(fatty) acid ligase
MEWLIERFQTAPERIAFIHEGREVSYGGVVASIDDFYKRVQDAGIKRGDTVVVLGDYSPEVFCMIMALGRNGSIVIPLTRTSVVEESVALAVSGCEWYVEFDAAGRDATITHRGLKSDNALLNEFRQRGTPGMVLFSSGSTGKPKGILHDFNQVTEKFRKQRTPVVAIPFLMIDHFGGINTILAITSSLGTVVTVADRSVANICAAIEKYKVELLPATPSFLTLMMASPAEQVRPVVVEAHYLRHRSDAAIDAGPRACAIPWCGSAADLWPVRSRRAAFAIARGWFAVGACGRRRLPDQGG